jgi:hypothetical protein
VHRVSEGGKEKREKSYALEAVNQSSVRSQLQVLHDLLQADQVLDVQTGRVLELVRCRVEVEEVDCSSERLGVGDEGGAEGGFAGTGGAGYEYGVYGGDS